MSSRAMHGPHPIVIADRVLADLENPESKRRGKRKLGLILKLSKTSPMARKIRHYINRLWKGETMVDVAAIAGDLFSSDPLTRTHAIETTATLGESGSPAYDDIVGIYHEMDEQLIGWGIPKSLKKAVKSIKKAAKKVKKHDFKKDIDVLNKVGKAVGPIAAAIPPPYGPAIAGGLMVLDAADKYNKGAISEIDVTKVMAAAGVEESQISEDILGVAQTIRNNVKANDLIDAVQKGSPAAIAKVKGIKEAAKAGSGVAQGAFSALKAANAGRKMSTADKKTLVAQALPVPQQAIRQSVFKSSRVMYPNSPNPVHVVSTQQSGVAAILAAVEAKKGRA